MKFPRNARILKGRQDAAPYAAVFFLLVLFVLLATLTYTPGVLAPLDLPVGLDLPGIEAPAVAVAIDGRGQLYYANALISDPDLKSQLRKAAAGAHGPLTLIVQADKAVRYDRLIQVNMLAREAGIHQALLATLPPPLEEPEASPAGSKHR